MKHTKLNFVCMGNICRSPLALVIFRDLARQQGLDGLFTLDSCGTSGWHAGHEADPRSVQIAAAHGLPLQNVARELTSQDFSTFDLLLAMDSQNHEQMIRRGAPPHKVRLMRSFDPTLANAPDEDRQVPDPYYGGDTGFENVYQMLDRACRGLLEQARHDRL